MHLEDKGNSDKQWWKEIHNKELNLKLNEELELLKVTWGY